MGVACLAVLKTAEKSAVFWGRFVEREGVARLETAQLSGLGFPCLKQPPLFDSIVAREGIETNVWVWNLARKLKILRRLRLFRLVVTALARFSRPQ